MIRKEFVVLHPGDFYFGKCGLEVHTLLGSCIAITLWHPKLKLGGMCHFALPDRQAYDSKALNGRYATDCIELFKQHTKKYHTTIQDYQAKIFGGGNIYNWGSKSALNIEKETIGERNSAAALNLLIENNVPVLVVHVGEFGYRKVEFDLDTGDVWVKFTPVKNNININALSGKS